ncbi:MAG: class II fructose-bisphosphate aldolase [Treponema sp.]|jgi:tagatose 1,6-diphosphate aldolase GatY/KbaY|nr:class II fructose-bisphosphate aldolase [Treponema sp.]
MPLINTESMLKRAREGGWAVGAFNAENMEMIQAIIEAAEELKAPVIIQTTPGTLKYGSLDLYFAIALARAKKSPAEVSIHLDHGDTFSLASQALRTGYTSIMIDGSKLPLGENIDLTESAVKICEPNGVSVEGELGRVGGKEDGEEGGDAYTDPEEAAEFVQKTGVNSLAVGVGTAHGVYKKTPVLKAGLISVLKETVTVPMVLHGASGLADEVVMDCISRGIAKVNFATELRIAYTEAVKKYLSGDSGVMDPKKYGDAARNAVRTKVIEKMRICGCAGKSIL